MSRKLKWLIFGGIGALLLGVLFFITREPPPPYEFLKKYPIVAQKITDDGKLKYLVVKGDFEAVSKAAQDEIARRWNLTYSSGGSMFSDGVSIQTRSFGSSAGQVTISTDIDGKGLDGRLSFGNGTRAPAGYCAVTYNRPPSIFDKAMAWVKGLFGHEKKPEPQPDGLMFESTTIQRT